MLSRRRAAVRAAVALFAATLLVAGGCGTGDQGQPADPAPGQIHLYGTDGNMMNSTGVSLKEFPGGLAGMKGTAPLTRLTESFKRRLLSVDPALIDYLYAGESYDAVVISALAATAARSTDPRAIASQINGVTAGGTVCDTPQRCLALVAEGRDIAYRGISLTLGGFTDAGEPSAGTYGILRFDNQNTLDDAKTEYVPTGDLTAVTQKRPPAAAGNGGGGPLRIGTLLPHTGALASAGPPMFAAVELAVREINQAGGVLGAKVVLVDGDDGTDPEVALGNANRLIHEANVHVIIGAGASSITKAVLPTVIGSGRILFSPCNTAAELSTADDNGLYFRTAPPDGLQATALTDIIMRDGVRRIYIVAREDAYGSGLMESVKANLIRAGLAESDIKALPYAAADPDFSNLGSDVKSFAPDGVLVIGFEESAGAIISIMKAGLRSRAI